MNGTPMATVLDPSGAPVALGKGLTLSTPGMKGVAHSFPRRRMGAPHLSTDLLDALSKSNVDAQAIIQISAAQELTLPVAPKIRNREAAMVLEVDDPGPGWGQFVLQTDEAGVTMWNFATNNGSASASSSGPTKRRYLLRRSVPPALTATPELAIAGSPGSKALHVLNFPWNPVGAIADALVGAWESVNRPYRVRTFTPQNYQASDVPQLSNDDWSTLATDKSLLIIHGTYSQSHTDFGRFPPDMIARLNAKYDGRVFAFDHPTLTKDPTENAQWFVNAMPEGTNLDLDIICHSRGGLVSRVLAEKMTGPLAGNRQVTVENLVFLATPNAGTILTDTDHLADYIDSYTNMLNFDPVDGVKQILEAIIAIAKLIAGAASDGLTGLESMRPDGPFLKDLNSGSKGSSQYFALGADFEPLGAQNVGWNGWFSDRIDGVFDQPNDSIVPTDGVWAGNGGGYFPIDPRQYVILPDTAGVNHGGFFQDSTSQDYIAGWLGVP
jgi:hypothetical protein